LAGEASVVVTGDFNVEPASEAYRILTGLLVDSRELSATPPHGPEGTFRGFIVEEGAAGRRIDYIFVRPGVTVHSYGVLTDHWDGHYPSDHLPVLAEIVLP
ncbi:MAG: endonuclease/exonuclease/phosphatase family protein, partial [Rhodothermales bacterium]